MTPEAFRPDALGYPSPSTARMIVVLMAMVAAGLFGGVWWHNATGVGDEWNRTVARCNAETGGLAELSGPGAGAAELARHAEFQRCTRPAEQRRALFQLGGAGVVGLGMVATMLAVPGIIVRRRRLTALPERLAAVQDRVAALAREDGVPRPPDLLLGRSVQRDAFSFGVPGRYRIALPPKVAVTAGRPTSQAVIRHELAHVRHGDVPLAWLARSAGYLLLPLLGVPAVIDLARGSVGFAVDYGLRATALGLVGWLAQSAWLRSREHVADLRAARGLGSPAPVIDALGSAVPVPSEGAPAWRRLIAAHPPAVLRADVLRRPAGLAAVTFVDGLTGAFFAAVLLPSVTSLLAAWLVGSGREDLVELLGAVLVGALLAGTLGLGSWRQGLLARIGGDAPRPWRVAAGAAVGTAVGELISLGNTGTLQSTGVVAAVATLVPAAAVAGATLAAAGLGELWADAAGSIGRPRGSWVPAVVLTGALYAFAVWAAGVLLLAVPLGWNGISQVLALQFGTWPGWGAALLLAAGAITAAYRTGSPRQVPGWLVERGEPGPWPVGRWLPGATASGLLGGVSGGAAIVVHRLLAGADQALAEQRFYSYVLAGAATGVLVAAVLVWRSGTGGYGAAVVAGPIAAAVSELIVVAMNTALGGSLTPAFTWAVVRPALGLELTLVLLLGGLLPWWARAARPAPTGTGRSAVAAAAAVLAPALAAAAVLASAGPLLPWTGAARQAPTVDARAAAQDYAGRVAPAITAAYSALIRQRELIEASGLPDRRQAALLRGRVLPDLSALVELAERFSSPDATVASVHADCVLALRAALAAVQAEASVLAGDPGASGTEVFLRRTDENRLWRAWQARVVILGG